MSKQEKKKEEYKWHIDGTKTLCVSIPKDTLVKSAWAVFRYSHTVSGAGERKYLRCSGIYKCTFPGCKTVARPRWPTNKKTMVYTSSPGAPYYTCEEHPEKPLKHYPCESELPSNKDFEKPPCRVVYVYDTSGTLVRIEHHGTHNHDVPPPGCALLEGTHVKYDAPEKLNNTNTNSSSINISNNRRPGTNKSAQIASQSSTDGRTSSRHSNGLSNNSNRKGANNNEEDEDEEYKDDEDEDEEYKDEEDEDEEYKDEEDNELEIAEAPIDPSAQKKKPRPNTRKKRIMTEDELRDSASKKVHSALRDAKKKPKETDRKPSNFFDRNCLECIIENDAWGVEDAVSNYKKQIMPHLAEEDLRHVDSLPTVRNKRDVFNLTMRLLNIIRSGASKYDDLEPFFQETVYEQDNYGNYMSKQQFKEFVYAVIEYQELDSYLLRYAELLPVYDQVARPFSMADVRQDLEFFYFLDVEERAMARLKKSSSNNSGEASNEHLDNSSTSIGNNNDAPMEDADNRATNRLVPTRRSSRRSVQLRPYHEKNESDIENDDCDEEEPMEPPPRPRYDAAAANDIIRQETKSRSQKTDEAANYNTGQLSIESDGDGIAMSMESDGDGCNDDIGAVSGNDEIVTAHTSSTLAGSKVEWVEEAQAMILPRRNLLEDSTTKTPPATNTVVAATANGKHDNTEHESAISYHRTSRVSPTTGTDSTNTTDDTYTNPIAIATDNGNAINQQQTSHGTIVDNSRHTHNSDATKQGQQQPAMAMAAAQTTTCSSGRATLHSNRLSNNINNNATNSPDTIGDREVDARPYLNRHCVYEILRNKGWGIAGVYDISIPPGYTQLLRKLATLGKGSMDDFRAVHKYNKHVFKTIKKVLSAIKTKNSKKMLDNFVNDTFHFRLKHGNNKMYQKQFKEFVFGFLLYQGKGHLLAYEHLLTKDVIKALKKKCPDKGLPMKDLIAFLEAKDQENSRKRKSTINDINSQRKVSRKASFDGDNHGEPSPANNDNQDAKDTIADENEEQDGEDNNEEVEEATKQEGRAHDTKEEKDAKEEQDTINQENDHTNKDHGAEGGDHSLALQDDATVDDDEPIVVMVRRIVEVRRTVEVITLY